MDLAGRSFHAEASGYFLREAVGIRGEKHLSPLSPPAQEK